METNHAQETPEDRQLQLEEENAHLRHENELLKRSLLELQNTAENYKEELLAFKRLNKGVFAEQIKVLKRSLLKKTQEIDRLLLELQRNDQVCDKNCTLCALLQICKMRLGYSVCGPQLALIILNNLPRDEITKGDLQCERMLDLFQKSKIVDVKSEYLYPGRGTAKLQIMQNVWDELMTMSGKECILGLKSAKAPGGGHCVVFDLESRQNGAVMIYDPKAPDLKEANMDRDAFMNYVKDGEGIRLYTVDLKQLEDTLHDVRDVMHVPDGQHFFFLSMAV